jgi:hypothetical protein
MRSVTRWLFLGTFASVSVLACASILDIQSLTNGPDPTDASQPDTLVPDVQVEAATCTPFHPPDAPDGSDNGNIDFTVGTSAMLFGIDKPEAADIYYDLDNECTCEIADAESCVRPTPNGQPAGETCDLSNGRDSAGNRAVALLTGVNGFNDTGLSTHLAAGEFGAVLSVKGYNGTPNDPHVRVDVARSFGTFGKNDAGLNGHIPLAGDGTDNWSYDPKIATDDGKVITSQFFDDKAYVNGGVLVAHFDVLILNLQFKLTNDNQITIRMTNAMMSANIATPDAGAGYALTNGRFVGRVTAGDLVKAFSAWTDPIIADNFTGICPGSPVFSAIVGKLCERLDIRSSIAEDRKNMPCNALSFGLGFGASPAKIYGGLAYPFKQTSCFDPKTYDPIAAGTYACQ